MIYAENTPNNMGVSICGDFLDFENLYDALHLVIGEEEELVEYDSAHIRVLGFCYDIRHAFMGNRDYEFVENGLDEEKKRRMEVLGPDKNIYLKVRVLWPETLFVMIALNNFLELYARKKSKAGYGSDIFVDTKTIWDPAMAQVRMLQAALAECLQKTISKASYARLLNTMNGRYVSSYKYISQYIDLLNHRFINMNPDKRIKSISVFAKRISQRDGEYEDLEDSLLQEAKIQNCHVDDLRLDLDFPEDLEW